jgi:hypothetical protein
MGKYSLIVVLALSFAILLYSNGFRTIQSASTNYTVEAHATQQARNIAYSSALFLRNVILEDESILPSENEVTQVPMNLSTFLPWEEMNGDYRYSLRNEGDTLLVLTSIGRYNNQTYRLQGLFNYQTSSWDPDLSKAVFSQSGIKLTGSSRIRGHAGTNATANNSVDLAWSTKIDSSLVIGPGGNVSTTVKQSNFQQGNVGLSITSLPAPAVFELPEFPEFPEKLLYSNNISASGGSNPPTINPSYYDGRFIPEINISGNRTVTIYVGDVDRTIHVGTLNIQQGHLNVIGTGKLTLNVENSITLNGSSTINNNRTADRMFTFYKGASKIDFGGSTTWKGGMYVESADIRIGGSGGISGNIITGGSSVDISGNAEANSRVLFAPNANVTLSGSGRLRGSIVAGSFSASGSTYVQYSTDFSDELPDFSGDEPVLSFRYWN